LKKIASLLDPRTKIVMVLCVSTLAVFVQNIYILFSVFVFTVLLTVLIGGNLPLVAKKIGKMRYLFFLIVIMQSIFIHSGKIIVKIGSFQLLTLGGILLGVEFILRIFIIVSSATILSTSSSREIIQGMVQWKIPYEIAFMVSIAIRFLPVLSREFKDIVTAIQLRGIDLYRIQIKKRIKIYYFIFTPVIIGAIRKAQKLSTAMETRAFRAYPKRTSYLVLKMNNIDYWVIAIFSVMAISVIILYFIFLRRLI
jgi:energy-coupling factor transport system permease protein